MMLGKTPSGPPEGGGDEGEGRALTGAALCAAGLGASGGGISGKKKLKGECDQCVAFFACREFEGRG